MSFVDTFTALVSEYIQKRNDFPPEKKLELIRLLYNYKKEKQLDSLHSVVESVKNETNITIPYNTVKRWITQLVCQDPNGPEDIKAEFCSEKKTESSTEKHQIDLLERANKDKESFISNVVTASDHTVLGKIPHFLVHPSILLVYEILKNTSINYNGRMIPLINVVIGSNADEPVGIMTFMNSAVLKYLQIVGILPGVTMANDFRDAIEKIYGSDVADNLHEFYTINRIVIRPRTKRSKLRGPKQEEGDEGAPAEG